MILYLKQAWTMVKQNRLFTAIYVAGTALAIATTMIMAIVYYVKIAPVYPEVNRNRTLYMVMARFVNKEQKWTNSWAYSYQALREWFYPLKNAVAVSAEKNDWPGIRYFIQPFDRSGDYEVKVRATDPQFFRIYRFRFLEGKPFTDADMASGVRSVVISDGLARRLFGTDTGVTGKEFTMNYMNYRVTGVVEEASVLTRASFGQVYMPYTTVNGYEQPKDNNLPYYGNYNVTLMVDSDEQEAALREEIAEIVRKYNTSQDEFELQIANQPCTHLLTVFQPLVGGDFSWSDVIRKYLLILLVLLLVPALNLSGMIAGRMDVRLAEMGIRKSFGACRGVLLKQVMWENLLLTLAGGVLGLLLAWMALVAFREWVFALFDSYPGTMMEGVTTRVSGEMLFAPSVFAAALLLCVLMNLLSALLPAWNSLRHPIIRSLNEKR